MTSEEAIAETTRRPVEFYRPLRMYLFGSAARGEGEPDSDLDFPVVVPDDHIAAETFTLDALRAATERTVALLKERHAALIADAVTGIETHLLANGYVAVNREGFDRARAIFSKTVLGFVRDTQPKEWAKLEALHGRSVYFHREPTRRGAHSRPTDPRPRCRRSPSSGNSHPAGTARRAGSRQSRRADADGPRAPGT